ncbi:hypothetical protein GC106_15010 [Kibdelosporangium sp. 4NS15]|uniref:Restriction endonuclease n=1 Tax=Kibdelosporangium persicum TaxID=2698649 RepID=A0ABX2EZT9_9PSEU|nr:hypothetical protein [Kibdelosporangium persicum]NRN64295.1 hypothetical protein [Kibdelosporangium persicum]
MTASSFNGQARVGLRLTDLKPYFSVTVLECSCDDPDTAFKALRRFLIKSANDQGYAVSIRLGDEIDLAGPGEVGEFGALESLGLGLDRMYAVTRTAFRVPGWAAKESGRLDMVNELTVAVRRNNMVAVYSDITSSAQFQRWVLRQAAPFRLISTDVLSDIFRGDGNNGWMRGVHRRRTTKPDSKAMGGMRIQDALDPIADGSYALTAAKVDFQPAEESVLLRDGVTFSAKSRVSWKPTPNFEVFLKIAAELLDLLEKSLTAERSPDAPFRYLAVMEEDLARVHGAFDVSITTPDQLRTEPNVDDDQITRAERLRDVLLEVRGDPGGAAAIVDVGDGGSVAGALVIKPVETRGGFAMDVRLSGPPSAERIVREIKDAIGDGDLLTVHYESGHAFTAGKIYRENLADQPFSNLLFEDFTGFQVTKEKPDVRGDQAIHDAIARDGDDSLFAWVVQQFGDDWLLCDDGAGEVADFLHLDNEGTLTAIQVKAADNSSRYRRIAVTRFEQVVSQAEKNIGLLDNSVLIDRLTRPRITKPAAWYEGKRIRSDLFVHQLGTRVTRDRTRVVIIQPHLLKSVYDQARATMDAGQPNRDAYGLVLLDTLLHSTRRTVTGRWDDLVVIGCE